MSSYAEEITLGGLDKPGLFCPVCGLQCSSGKAKVDDSFGKTRVFTHCFNCKHLWLAPLPAESEVNEFYKKELAMDGREYAFQYQKNKLKVFKAILEKYKLLDCGSVVEIGPGPIGIMPILSSGSIYFAVEPGLQNRSSLAQIARDNSLHFSAWDSVDVMPDDILCDLLFSVAAFEHMIDPRGAFMAAVGHLKPGGYVVFGVPDRNVEIPDHVLIKIGVSNEVRFCKTHLHSFDESSVRNLFDQAGVDFIGLSHMLNKRNSMSHHKVSSMLEEGVIKNKLLGIRWLCKYTYNLALLKIHRYLMGILNNGDDRCEVVYIGVKR